MAEQFSKLGEGGGGHLRDSSLSRSLFFRKNFFLGGG